jgi:hypothetical protein
MKAKDIIEVALKDRIRSFEQVNKNIDTLDTVSVWAPDCHGDMDIVPEWLVKLHKMYGEPIDEKIVQ